MISKRKIILASTSPYRADALRRLRLAFDISPSGVDESALAGERPEQLAIRLSVAKAKAVASRHPDALIIGSDQVADLEGEAIGKPGHRAGAISQLQKLSGRTLVFHSGLALLDAGTSRVESLSVPTTVIFRTLTLAEIESYVDREPAFDCAGSAKSEGLGIALLEAMRGDDPTALIGLPLIALSRMLRAAGVQLP